MGQLVGFGWNFSIFISLSTSANRLIAIALPLLYMRIFKPEVVKKIVLVSMLMALIIACFAFVDKCGMFFDPQTFVWFYEESACTEFVNLWLDYVTGLVTLFSCLLAKSTD
uniref:7TM_GPCR_Srx domain-containing protein n=1 Tax=Rhabditophanes sp. KR3021 TaxID=114890 RepID=A0AC35U2N3_9BILA